MKDILIVAHFTLIPGEIGNGRFSFIADMLEKNGHHVEIVTSNFSHDSKKHRNDKEPETKYKLTMLEEDGYRKNVSLKRFYSHYIFGKNLKSYLQKRKKPDLIYCAVPSLDASFVAAQYAKKNKVKFIIDVQDIWPEAFKMVFNIPVVSNMIFYPLNKKANYIYRSADDIVAVSDTYVNRARQVNKDCMNGISVFLGTDLSYFDRLASESQIVKPENEIWLAYIGTLGHSYDLPSVIDALEIVRSTGIENIKFIVMGDGPLRTKFENYAQEKGIYCEFTGSLKYSKMVEVLVKCDIAVNPITKGTAASIINKVGDYASAGLPVINTQESQEYQNLLNSYHAGINCENNNPGALAEQVQYLYRNAEDRKRMGANNRKLAEERFDRNQTYQKILTAILEEEAINI